MMALNMGFATLFLDATITKVLDKNTGKERPRLIFSDIHTNPRDIKIDRIMTENVDKDVITRDIISLIFYEVSPTIGVVLTDMIDGTKVVPKFLAGPITTNIISHLKEVREKVIEVLISQPDVTKVAWSKDRDCGTMLTNLKKVFERKPAEGTPLKRELVLWNKVILIAFGSLIENRPQELLLLVCLRVYNDADLFKMSRCIKLGEVWSTMFGIYTGLDNGQHRMLTWLRLACFFDEDIFEGNNTMMGWINYPPAANHL
jgi:hypothetical protein